MDNEKANNKDKRSSSHASLLIIMCTGFKLLLFLILLWVYKYMSLILLPTFSATNIGLLSVREICLMF